MAKAVVPMHAFRRKFGELSSDGIAARLQELVVEFLQHEQPVERKLEKVTS